MIDIDLPGGRYVIAVSGGVDSVALLHLLAGLKQKNDANYKFIVAHFDHGIRSDSVKDRQHVQRLAKHYKMPFVYERAELGMLASEATARKARYEFLHKARLASRSDAVITAHHEDDVLETAILNLLRGTKGRGLHSLKSTDVVRRPLLHVTKKQLRDYARLQGLVWREDSTNANMAILRNYVRGKILVDIGKTRRTQLLRRTKRAAEISAEIDQIIANYLHVQPERNQLDRLSFIDLPHNVAREIMATWLKHRAPEVELNHRLLERLVVSAKIGRSSSCVDVANGFKIKLSPKHIILSLPRSES